jgi:hypothetical protein
VTFTPTDTSNYNTVAGSASVTVNKATVAISITSSVNPSTYGNTVTLQCGVSGVGIVPTGTVTLSDGETQLTTLTLDSAGVTTYITPALVAGSHTLKVTYNGDNNYR